MCLKLVLHYINIKEPLICGTYDCILVFQTARVHLLDTESFDHTFGKKAHRKRPNLKSADLKVTFYKECKKLKVVRQFLLGIMCKN